MGGLVSSYFALNLAKDVDIKDIITIASPFHGTMASFFGIGKCVREMKKDSKFVTDLSQQILLDEKIRFYHIATHLDHIVIPYDSALLGKNKDREYTFDNIGHSSLLFSEAIASDSCDFFLILNTFILVHKSQYFDGSSHRSNKA